MTASAETKQSAASQPSLPNLLAVKARQQQMWASGDFAVIGTTLQWVGEELCEAVDVLAEQRVLDVACGNGNASLAAARRFAQVVGVDYVPALLEGGRRRAQAEGLHIEFREGDAEQLSFADASFDVALSTFGVMFAPDHEQCARQLSRVVKPGGRIGLASWTAEGFVGQLLKAVGKHVAPPPGVKSPALWGNEAHLRSLFPNAKSFKLTRKNFMFRYASAAHFIDIFRRYYGPTHKAFLALDANGQAALNADMTQLLERSNRAAPHSLVVPGEYLESIIEV